MKRNLIVLCMLVFAGSAFARSAAEVRSEMDRISAELSSAKVSQSRIAELKMQYERLYAEGGAQLDDPCPGEAPNSFCAGAELLTLNDGITTVGGSNFDGGDLVLDSDCGTSITSCVVWYSVTGTGFDMRAHTCNDATDFDTKLHVLTGNCGEWSCVAYNDDWFSNPEAPECQEFSLASDVNWCTEAGVTYYIVVSGFAGSTGDFGLTVEDLGTPCTPPCNEQWYYFNPDQVPFCQCLTICPEQIQKIFIGPAGPNDYPVASWGDGCGNQRNIPPDGCEEPCNPAYPELYMDWIYLPESMQWCMDIYSADGGCYCFCIDRILPVELNSFAAISGDRQATISWTTASETDVDRFELARDGQTVASLTAHNSVTGAAYSWTDVELTNGTTYTYALTLVNLDGTREMLASETVTPSASAVANNFALYQNYPNPFNPETNIHFDLVEAGQISLMVFNIAGQEIATIAQGTYAAGRHTVSFDGSALASGVYLYRLEANGRVAQHKMVLLK
ncbi:MAG: T9SS type A sorting domain-containing protein [bacterium]|nr:T9SS type A sorting domain-containing protein [bacterium]